MHQFETPQIPHIKGTDDCYRNCTPTLHETVQNGASRCELHGRNSAPNKNINPAKMRGYASKCEAPLEAGEAIRTPDIHFGNVITHSRTDSESSIIGDIGKGVPETDPSCAQDELLVQLNQNWSSLPKHIKLAIQALVKAGSV